MYSVFFRFFRILKYKISKNYSTFSVFNFLNTKSIFIDIGGNLGSVSQYVQDVCKPRVIEIYEPHSLLYSSLKKRFRNYKNINIFNYAVSDTNSQGILYLKNKNQKDLKKLEGSSLEKNKKNINKDYTQKIKLIHIKKIISSFKYIDCIKIDIEGHEYKILDSLIENKDKIGKVVCEFHGTDEDLKNNKNFEFRKDYLSYRNKILKHKKNKWLIEWI